MIDFISGLSAWTRFVPTAAATRNDGFRNSTILGGMMISRTDMWKSLAACILACGFAAHAKAQVIYYEDFEDADLVPGTTLELSEIHDGIVTFTDAVGGDRGQMTVEFVTAIGGPLAVPTATFSWDVVEPVYAVPPEGPAPGNSYEMVIRAGIGTGGNSLSNAQHIAEGIVYRTDTTEPVDHTRGAYENNGQETLFMVVNNQNAPTTFPHPGDGTDVNMLAWQTATYVYNAATDAWGVVRGVSNFRVENMADFGDFERMSIGSSSDGHQGGFGMDNVLVMEGITFERAFEPADMPGDVNGDEMVDMADFAIIQMHFQQDFVERIDGDLVNDDVVDFLDFRQWKSAAAPEVIAEWAALGVPEPTSLASAGLAIAAGVAARRRRLAARWR